MDQSLLYGLIFGMAWGLPLAALAWWLTGPSQFQLNEYYKDVQDAVSRGDDADKIRIVMTTQQWWIRTYALLIVAVSASVSGYIFSLSGPRNGVLDGGGACLIVAVLVVVLGAVFGPIVIPQTPMPDQSAWLVRAREKHEAIKRYGWPGKPGKS
jgi:hypothetical protein